MAVDAAKLAKYRKRLGMSQYGLASATGVSRSYISDIEQGTKQPRELAAKALAKALGVTVEDLKTDA